MMSSVVRRLSSLFAVGACVLASLSAQAGNQQREQLAASVRAAMHRSVSDAAPAEIPIKNVAERNLWLAEMSQRLKKRVPDLDARRELLTAIHYEATRAGLDPQLVLGLIQVESRFNKYALSKAGARGYMQVMPFWVDAIGGKEDNLFHLRTNLRYGCAILRHYIDLEKGNLFLALGRYNGSRGRAEYPNLVRNAWQNHWGWEIPSAIARTAATSATPTAAAADKPVPTQASAAIARTSAATATPRGQPTPAAPQTAMGNKPVSQPAAPAMNATRPPPVASASRLVAQASARRDIVIVR
jgi:hypothetical protein